MNTILMSVLLLISFLLDVIVPNLLRNFIPFFVIAIIVISSFFKMDDFWYYLVIFITGVAYDLTCTSAVFLHGFLFCFIGYLSKLVLSNKSGFIASLLAYYGLSVLYVFLIMILTFTYVPDMIISINNKIFNSFIINSVFFITFYLLFIGLVGLIWNRSKKSSYF